MKQTFDYGELPQHSVTLCSFSRGKDAIATYLEVRDKFEEVVPFYLYGVPDLEFVEESLAYYEKLMGRRIIRLPQPKMYEMLNNMTYQPPVEERYRTILGWQLPNFDHVDVHHAVCRSVGVNPIETYTAIGLKLADSIQRRTALTRNGLVTHSKQKYYPIAYYSKQDVLDKCERAGWKLPIDYRYFKDSFDGLQIRYMLPIKQHFPRDYQKILEWFPLVELEVMPLRKIYEGSTVMSKPLKPLKPLGALKPLIPEPLPESTLAHLPVLDNPEDSAKRDHVEMMKMLRRQQREAIDEANDAGYWFGVYFQNRHQKEAFIKAIGAVELTEGQYIDGNELAKVMGIELPERVMPYKVGQIDKKCAALT